MNDNKKIEMLLTAATIVFLTVAISGCSDAMKFKRTTNPLVRHMYTADPSARVFGDRLYLYTSHDENDAVYFDMLDWHVFSTHNMVDWKAYGPVFSLDDISWADKWAWAPDCVERDGKYFFYYPVERTKIGVAVSHSPTGPFVDPLDKPLIDNATNKELIGPEPIDPAVLIDDDGQAYMYFGCRHLRIVKLKENMTALDGPITKGVIQGNENDQENDGGYYGEGPWVFKRHGIYYLMYSNGWGERSTLVYAMAENPMGPFQFMGEVMSPVDSWTSHGSIVEFKGRWYIFYHNVNLSKNNYRRSICFDEITFTDDGRIDRLLLDNDS